MPPAEDEIWRRLAEFAAHWDGYQGSERAETQTFLNQLLERAGFNRAISAGEVPYHPFD